MRMYWILFSLISLIAFATVSHAAPMLSEENFSDLIASDRTFAVSDDIAPTENKLWETYRREAQADSERKIQHDRRQLTYGDKTMRFSFERRGSAPASGYPVYIALHGGGGAPSSVNDSQWEHMKIYYRDSVSNGIYIAPRGVSDTWDLHFQSESYPLYDRLIENLIAYENADPNRIYLLGFSAGGDGVYQVVPRMPDRFAAANMSAGHHNWIRFDNLLNTPFLLQVGERDSAYNRNRVATENFITLNNLKALHRGYIHDLFIHAGYGHNGWYDNDESGALHRVINDPVAWLQTGNRAETNKNTNAVHWLNNYRRDSLPTKIIWDLSTRSPRSKTWGVDYVIDDATISATQDLFYWLAIDTQNITSGRIEAEISRENNSIIFNDVTGISDLRILLRRDMLDFSRPIAIYLRGDKIKEITPTTELRVMARTLLERGDPSYLFHTEVPVHFPDVGMSLHEEEFSYCSNGNCRVLTANDFFQARNFPTDLNYSCQANSHYALTFDDGPSANLPEIFDILEKHNVKATFFINGSNIISEEGRALIKQAHERGHEIANHTFSHRSLVELSAHEILDEVQKTQDAILSAIGNNTSTLRASYIVRPPFGNIDQNVSSVLRESGFVPVRWNSDRYDWQLSREESPIVKERVAQHLAFIRSLPVTASLNRSIIDVNHDKSPATLAILDEIIPLIKNEGYEFVPMSQCLGLDNN